MKKKKEKFSNLLVGLIKTCRKNPLVLEFVSINFSFRNEFGKPRGKRLFRFLMKND